jgi:2-polyprenyl-3-methyl-5-hydroxy-6-metoxy-1,4-benzoquinol methylase
MASGYARTAGERLASRLLARAPRHAEAHLDERSFWEHRWAERIAYLERHGAPFEGHDSWQGWISQTMCRHYFRLLGGDVTGCRAIELGSGSGFVSLLLAQRGAEVTLVDFAPTAIAYSQRIAAALGVAARAVFRCQDMFDLPAAGAFDFAFNSGVAEHYRFEQAVALVRVMAGAVRPGGLVSVTIPNLLSPELLWRMAREGKMSERYVSLRELRAVLEAAGLRQVHTAATNTIAPSFLPMPLVRGVAALRPHRWLGRFAFLVTGFGIRPALEDES